MNTESKTSSGAFTRVELCAICSVVLVWLMICAPMSARVMGNSEAVVCQNNMNQLARALAIYCGNYNEYLPPNILDSSDSTGNSQWVAGSMTSANVNTNWLNLTNASKSMLAPYL